MIIPAHYIRLPAHCCSERVVVTSQRLAGTGNIVAAHEGVLPDKQQTVYQRFDVWLFYKSDVNESGEMKGVGA